MKATPVRLNIWWNSQHSRQSNISLFALNRLERNHFDPGNSLHQSWRSLKGWGWYLWFLVSVSLEMYLAPLLTYCLLGLGVLSYRLNHRRPLADTLRQVMTAYFHHYRAGYLVVCSLAVKLMRHIELNLLQVINWSKTPQHEWLTLDRGRPAWWHSGLAANTVRHSLWVISYNS